MNAAQTQRALRSSVRGGVRLQRLSWPLYALVLFTCCLAAVWFAPRDVERTAQSNDVQRFLYGMGAVEQNESQTFRWTGRDWGIALFGQPFGEPTLVTLHASATRPPDQSEARLRLVGSPEGGAFDVAREPRIYHLIARPTDANGGRQQIMFTGTAWSPIGSDGRELGVALSSVRVTQLGEAPLLPLLGRGLFFGALALGTAVAIRLIGMPRGIGFAFGAVVALVLAIFHLRDAQTLGFLLPNVWWIIAGFSAALAVANYRLQIADSGIVQRLRTQQFLGFGLALLGTIGLWLRVVPVWLGLALAILGALVVALTADNRQPTTDKGVRTFILHPSSFILFSLSLILLIAVFLRLFRLNDQPMALWRDEVYHAELAQQIWRDASFRPVYVPDVDLPALLFYLISPPIGMFGADLWTLRVVPALAGALSPLALWFALGPIFGRRVATIAAWCMAVAAWSLYMSRWTFPVIFDPLFTLLAIGCVWRAFDQGSGVRGQGSEDTDTRKHGDTANEPKQSSFFIVHPSSLRFLWAAMGGICAGLVVYTYHTGRIEPLVVGMFALLRVATNAAPASDWRSGVQHFLRSFSTVRGPLLVAAVAFGLTVAPLAHFALTNPEAFSKRLDRVNIFNGPDAAPTAPLTVLADQLERHALMWNVRGDQNARHYAPFRPMLDPFMGALFLAGVAVCLLRRRGAATWVLLVWLGVGLVPGILSDVAPHAMRTIGALAPACALAAIGFEHIFATKGVVGADRDSPLLRPLRFKNLLPLSVLSAMLIWNAGLYFSVTNNLQEYYYHFETQRSVLARAARTVATDHPDVRVYLPDMLREGKAGQATTLLLNNAPVGWLDGERLDPAPTTNSLLLLPGDMATEQIAEAQRSLGPHATLLRTGPLIPFEDKPIYLVYGTGPNAQTIANQLALP